MKNARIKHILFNSSRKIRCAYFFKCETMKKISYILPLSSYKRDVSQNLYQSKSKSGKKPKEMHYCRKNNLLKKTPDSLILSVERAAIRNCIFTVAYFGLSCASVCVHSLFSYYFLLQLYLISLIVTVSPYFNFFCSVSFSTRTRWTVGTWNQSNISFPKQKNKKIIQNLFLLFFYC